jgi:hypothetical protein
MRNPVPAAYHLRVEVGVNAGARADVIVTIRTRATVGGLTAGRLATGAATA